jgi:endonuclease G
LNDFSTVNPAAPRNAASPVSVCSGGGTTLFASGSANPGSVAPGATTLLTVTVTPATTPPSTGITVVANLSNIGGSATQTFFDDGTNGDVTPGDNIFSFQYTIPANASNGGRTLPFTAYDAQGRTANSAISLVILAPALNDNPLLLGNPSNAVTDANQPFNYLMVKPQYSLSYHRDRRIPNWVAWRLDTSWLGTASRQDDYRPDETLPAGWYRVTPQDYSEPIYDRGHMVPSGDRTRSAQDNSATFLMTNFVPQTPENNQRAWERLETYCRELAQAGNELYIVSGGAGSRGTIGNGVVIPQVTWKVILVIPNGDNDLQRIGKTTRTIAVIMPNDSTVTFEWRQYRTSVDKVENLTGFDFFSNVSKITQSIIERRVDNQ